MPPRIRFLYASLAVVFFCIAAVPLYRELSSPADIWWTPRTMLVPLTGSQDRVEIYARGKLLLTLIEAGQLRIADDTGASRSEEHTSELQSHHDLVCRLLLEKQKNSTRNW